MKMKIISIVAFVSLLLIGCSDNQPKNEAESPADIKTLVHDYTVGNKEAASASITSSELVVTDEKQAVTTYALPTDEFFVSIAPFVNETHPCDIHSLTGCQGELVEEEFNVHIVDANGNVILEETKKTEANGFIDLWLPRDDTFTVTITQDERETNAEITTFEGDNTCITTMQLG